MARAPRALLHNWRLKLSALGLSVFLWALVQTEPLSQETFSAVPVRVEVSDTSWTAAGVPRPATVELRLGGPAREIIRLAREGTSVRVPIATVGSRDTVVTLQREWVDLGQGAGVTVESVSPSALAVSFEPAVTRTFPLAMRITGELPEHLALTTQLVINPDSVRVRGPESGLAGLDSIPMVPFDFGTVRESDAFTVAIDASGVDGASVFPAEALLGVRVEPREEREMDEIVVHADPIPGEEAVVVEPATIGLRLVGARSLLTALDMFLLRVSVDPASIRRMQDGEERRVQVRVDGIPELVEAYPSTDVVIVRRAIDVLEAGERNLP